MGRQNVEDIYKLSPMQHGMLFHSLEAPGSGVYFEQFNFTLHGLLNTSAFRQAWQQVIARHTVLRTSFLWENLESPLQVVYKQVELPWIEQDWQHLVSTEQQTRLDAFLQADISQGFDLRRPPLMRCALFQLDAETYQFVWSHHHALMDGWCLTLLTQEVLACYEALAFGRTTPLPTSPPYRNYIGWLQEQDRSKAKHFWQENLAGFETPSSIGISQNLSEQSVEAYVERRIVCPPTVTEQLRTLAQQHHLTFNTLVQTAWALVLSYNSGEPDVVFGATVSGRPPSLAGVETIVGLFINTLPMRAQLTWDTPLIEWMRQLQDQQVEREQFSYPTLVDIQGWSSVPRDLPLFDSILVFENYPVYNSLQEDNQSSLTISNVENFERTNYPLTLTASAGETLTLRISYDTQQYTEKTIQGILEQLQVVLTGMAENPQQRLGEISVLSAQMHQQLSVWNQTELAYPAENMLIHRLFAAHAQQKPEAIAVVWGEQKLTYEDLERQSNQLAHYLRSHGIGPDVRVGICIEKSPQLLVAILGVLKAGGGYVPLDPSYPKPRLSFMLSDAQVPVIVAQRDLLSELPVHSAQVITLDGDGAAISQASMASLPSEVAPENLAYVVYTSGSTGTPKGVMVTHGSLTNAYYAWEEAYHLQELKRHLQMASFSFDVFSGDLVRALGSGGCLVMCPRDNLLEPARLYQLLKTEHIDIAEFVPAVFRSLASYLHQTDQTLAFMKAVIVGSDSWSMAEYHAFKTVCGPQTRLINSYGVSEATIDSTYFELTEDTTSMTLAKDISVPIGRPFGNMQLYVLNGALQPVPIGTVGELFIGGRGLARGYLNNPAKTATAFIPNPLQSASGISESSTSRLYRTGDLARWLVDGNIEFIGRLDNQVKIRGVRIELGEVEATIAKLREVQQVVVLAQDDHLGNARLVAYVVPDKDWPGAMELRQTLRQQLPKQMVPTIVVEMAALPLTPNGKIDRRALPAPQQWDMHNSDTPPRNPTEQMIAETFEAVLKVSGVGAYSDFFDLGGHSLLATQVISRLRNLLQMEIPLKTLFEFSTVSELAQALMSSERQTNGIMPLLPVERGSQPIPLSWAQERLWFLAELEGPSATYNLSETVQIQGGLDIEALEQALTAVVRRHESLRTTFPVIDGTPVQKIAPPSPIRLPVVDLQLMGSSDMRMVEAKRLAAKEIQCPFNLATDALLRVTLFQLEEKTHVLVAVLHHIIADGWSMGVLIQELSVLYQSARAQSPEPLPKLPIQYADFASWQRRWLTGEVLETQLNYWKHQLAGIPNVLDLPTDNPRPLLQTFQGRKATFHLDFTLTTKLKALSQKSGVTLFMTLLSAFALLLSRYTAQDDIVIGAPIANRNRQEIEPLIGFFVNTLVLRIDLSAHPTLKELLQQVRQTTLDAYDHQDVPFERLVEVLQPQRSLSHHPIFQVMFALQNAPLAPQVLPDLTLTSLQPERAIAKFDWTLFINETPNGLAGTWEYNSDLFTAETIDRLIGHFQILLGAMVETPSQTVKTLPLLNSSEQHQLLVEWNNTAKPYPQEKCIHHWFEAQVEKDPNTVAVIFEDKQLTYQALNARANQLAHYLQSLGVGPDVLVGICVDRSLEMIVGLLGILKAGGAYVPLDPSYPPQRLQFMLSDAQPSVLLTQVNLLANLPHLETQTGNEPQIVCLDRDWLTIGQSSEENLQGDAAPVLTLDNLAYINYTSGSTGTPKGVCVPQRGVVRLVIEPNYVTIREQDTFLQLAPVSFDAATFEIWGALLNGARLVLYPERLPVLETLATILQQEAISILWLTAGLFHFVIEQQPEALSSVKQLLAGGDVLSIQHIQKALSALPNCTLINGYGPTENTTFTCCYPIPRTISPDHSMPIGRPINNTQVYVLDSSLQPVPIGVPGELYIGGDGLARGYLNRPDLTEKTWIVSPFNPQARLYKTGDLVRYLPDGNIEFLGRQDFQIKIRGFRIELGEIEAVINRYVHVQQCIVIAHEERPGNKILVAYVVDKDGTFDINGLKQFLNQQLPNYIVPSLIMPLAILPLTANGKVDRQALPQPDFASLIRPYEAPSTSTEKILATLWEEVLDISPIGREDAFFDLGGHSLLATQLISRIRSKFQIELPLRTLFEQVTLSALAQQIDITLTQEHQNHIPPLLPVDRAQRLPLSFAQERLWFLDQLMPNSPLYNMPAAMQLVGALNPHALVKSFQTIVHRHEVLRTAFSVQEDGQPYQHIMPPFDLEIPIINLESLSIEAQAQKVQSMAAEEANQPFDLTQAPLIRVTLMRLKETEHIVLVTLHHIAADGWSVGVLMTELAMLYPAFDNQQPLPLAPLPLQYADFAAWQRQALVSDVMEPQLTYWQEQLVDLPACELPSDYPRTSAQNFTGEIASLRFSAALTAELNEFSRANGVTLFMTLVTAFKILLYRYTQQTDIVIGTDIANRNQQEIENLIGFFVNQLVLRTSLDGNPTFKDLLQRVRQTTLAAYAHQDLPFQKLVQALQPERALNQTPLFQIKLILQNTEESSLEIPGLTLVPLQIDETTAPFDLILSFKEGRHGLTGTLTYNKSLFESTTIDQLLQRFENLLEKIIDAPDTALTDINLLSDIERKQLAQVQVAENMTLSQQDLEGLMLELNNLS
ncbi:amino acid adenylation domain-containing protein [Leptothoe sp. EHU-05/26/07-4]